MLHGFAPIEEIDLRWTLRDIRARRFKIASISAETIQQLADLGLVEMRDEGPVLTEAGVQKIEAR
jgi:Mn-dependent DtxR family transcriptional regulator